MSKFIIKGGETLAGNISVSGAKNSALKIIPAALLSAETITIKNLPLIDDVERSFELLMDLGAKINRHKNEANIDTSNLNSTILNDKMEIREEIETVVTANKTEQNLMIVMPIILIAAIKGMSPEFAANFATIGSGASPP